MLVISISLLYPTNEHFQISIQSVRCGHRSAYPS